MLNYWCIICVDFQLFPLQAEYSTFAAVEAMARSGVERIPMIDNKRKINGIITQSMVISLLAQVCCINIIVNIITLCASYL